MVLDKDFAVKRWNTINEDLWGARAEEVQGQNFLNLDIGLPVEQLRKPIRACLLDGSEDQELHVNAVNRRGKPIECQVLCVPLKDSKGSVQGIILLIDGVVEKPDAKR